MDVLVLGRLEATEPTWTPTERPVEVAWEPARPLYGFAGPGAGGSSIRSTHQAGTSSRVRTADAGFDAGKQSLTRARRRSPPRSQVTLAVPDRTIQRAIDPEEADLLLDSHMPQAQIATLRTDPAWSRRLSVNTTGSLRFLVLGTHRRAGAIADVRARRAEIDQRIMRDAPGPN